MPPALYAGGIFAFFTNFLLLAEPSLSTFV